MSIIILGISMKFLNIISRLKRLNSVFVLLSLRCSIALGWIRTVIGVMGTGRSAASRPGSRLIESDAIYQGGQRRVCDTIIMGCQSDFGEETKQKGIL